MFLDQPKVLEWAHVGAMVKFPHSFGHTVYITLVESAPCTTFCSGVTVSTSFPNAEYLCMLMNLSSLHKINK